MRSRFANAGWGVYCACSWTWCIAMYLPVLMLDRFGWPGFLAFALPNVLGCTAFGYLVRTRARSESMVQRHGSTMVAFSLVTVGYHLLFICILFEYLRPAGRPWLGPMVAVLLYLVAWLPVVLRDRSWVRLAALVYGVSLAVFLLVYLDRGGGGGTGVRADATEGGMQLLWLTPILWLGFLSCPYLDLTFHRAVQQAPSPHAFLVFAVAFTVMVVMTCVLWRPALPAIALVHLLAQSLFTVSAHLREAIMSRSPRGGGLKVAVLAAPLAAVVVLPVLRAISERLADGEDTYLRYLVFYGLVFPAYVLVFMGPGRPPRRAGRPRLAALIAVVVLVAPLYELGILQGHGWLLLVPTAAAVAWLVLHLRR